MAQKVTDKPAKRSPKSRISAAREDGLQSPAAPLTLQSPPLSSAGAGPEAETASGTNTREGESGTSADSGPETIEVSGGTQSAPPHNPIEGGSLGTGGETSPPVGDASPPAPPPAGGEASQDTDTVGVVKLVDVLVVVGPVKGRRRAGLKFGPEMTVLPLAILRDEEIDAIEADPVLKSHREQRPATSIS